MRITAERLRKLEVREGLMKIFEEEWPEGMEVTGENCLRIVEIGFDIDWMAKDLLSPAALAEYVKIRDAALAEYVKLTDAALAEYVKIRDAALAEYVKLTDVAWAEYHKARALAFWQVAK